MWMSVVNVAAEARARPASPASGARSRSPADARARLERTAAPGRGHFALAAGCRVAGTAADVAFWLITAGLFAGVAAHTLTPAALGHAGAVLGVVVLGRGLAGYGARRGADAGAEAVSAALARQVLRATLRPAGWGDAEPAALAHAVLELADQIGDYHRTTRPARLACPAAAGVLAVVAVLHWPAALLLAATTPLIPLNLHLAGHATRAVADRQLREVRALSARLADRFRGLRTLAMLGAAPREAAAVSAAAAGLNRASAAVLRRAFISSAVLDIAVTFAIALTALYTGLMLLGYLPATRLPRLTLSTALQVLVLAPVYFAPLRALGAGYHEREAALAALDTLDTHPAPPHPPSPRPSPSPSPGPPTAQLDAPAVELDTLTVRYPGAQRPVLQAVTVRLAPGRVAAVCAPSGAGKTTLLATIAGLITPSAGTVTLGCAPASRPPSPTAVSWLGQTTLLLAGSLADNIRLGNPTASGHAVHDAARRAGLADLLACLPDGLGTRIGAGGWGVSAGQAQRVALARALLRDAPLWLLDEPTAHLDAAGEAELCRALARAWRGRTVLIATHSPAVTALADEIWTLAGGQLLVEKRR